MSISVTQVLPNSPTLGVLTYIPLGGDGFTSPHAAWEVNTQLVGDASGGQLSISIEMDDRFVSLVPWVGIAATQVAAADVEALLNVGEMAQRFDLLSVDPSGGSAQIAELFRPPPALLPGNSVQTLRLRVANITNDLWRLKSYILLFNIDVRTKFPLGPLLFASGST